MNVLEAPKLCSVKSVRRANKEEREAQRMKEEKHDAAERRARVSDYIARAQQEARNVREEKRKSLTTRIKAVSDATMRASTSQSEEPQIPEVEVGRNEPRLCTLDRIRSARDEVNASEEVGKTAKEKAKAIRTRRQSGTVGPSGNDTETLGDNLEMENKKNHKANECRVGAFRTSRNQLSERLEAAPLPVTRHEETVVPHEAREVEHVISGELPIAAEINPNVASIGLEDQIRTILNNAPVASVVEERTEQLSRKKKIMAATGCILVSVLLFAVVALLLLSKDGGKEMKNLNDRDNETASSRLSTKEEVISRGFLRCGLYATYVGFSRVDETAGLASGFNWDLCRAVAAVVLGDANAVEPVVATAKTRFTTLKERKVDMVAMTTTHNMGRDVWEDHAFMGCTYSVPYVYTGMAFSGTPNMVACAEALDFFTGECRDLVLCVREGTSYDGKLDTLFPGPERKLTQSHLENFQSLEQGICNVVVDGSAALPETIARSFGYSGDYILGEKRFSKEPFSLNTREDDPEWSNLVNLVMKGLYTAEAHGITKSNAVDDLDVYSDLDKDFKSVIADSVSAVGNINEMYSRYLSDVAPRSGLNTLNDGTSGLIYSFPLGKVWIEGEIVTGGLIESILDRGFLRCGVTKRAAFADFDGATWTGMDVELCRAVAAAIFSRDASSAVVYVDISNTSNRFALLSQGEVDLLAGERVSLLNGWREPPPVWGIPSPLLTFTRMTATTHSVLRQDRTAVSFPT